jgi:hypothetical protein
MAHLFPICILQLLNSNKSCPDCLNWPKESGIAEAEFGSILKLPQSLSLYIVCAINRNCLEFPPSD